MSNTRVYKIFYCIFALVSILYIGLRYSDSILNVHVIGKSMLPTLSSSDVFITRSISASSSKLQRGDIVIATVPDIDYTVIKRVIGVSGDRITINSNGVVINGERIIEPYVKDKSRQGRTCCELTIPDDSYFLMGDNRSVSYDSRHFGVVKLTDIEKKVVFHLSSTLALVSGYSVFSLLFCSFYWLLFSKSTALPYSRLIK